MLPQRNEANANQTFQTFTFIWKPKKVFFPKCFFINFLHRLFAPKTLMSRLEIRIRIPLEMSGKGSLSKSLWSSQIPSWFRGFDSRMLPHYSQLWTNKFLSAMKQMLEAKFEKRREREDLSFSHKSFWTGWCGKTLQLRNIFKVIKGSFGS